jgi:xylan 1,4-beta-xylosidase
MTLIEAIKNQDLEQLKQLLIQKPECIDDVDEKGIPASFIAAKTGNLAIVKYIVEYSRASMNLVDAMNRKILHYSAMSGNVALNRYLVERVGMSIVEPDGNLVTPFHLAHNLGHKALEHYFESVCNASLSDMYENPIRSGMFPDPSVVRVGEDYFMVNSSFIFFPCIPISHSKDLIHWKIIGHAITNPEWAYLESLEGGRGYWAPDISYHDGRFYIVATYRLNDTGTLYRKQMVVSSDKPEGPYTKPTFIDEDGIDPSLFTDDDGKRYMLLNRGARIFEVSSDGTQQVSEAKLLFYGDQKRAPEGPHLLKKAGYYYLFLAEGGTGPGHRITVARATTLFGQYEPCPYNPIMRQQDPKAAIQRCGHGKPIQTQQGEWYMIYLCGRSINGEYTILGRETALDPIRWTSDGWPIVNELKGPSALQIKPNLPKCKWASTDADYFDSEILSKEWMFPRTFSKDDMYIKQEQLWIQGSQYPMESIKARSILLRRQKHVAFIGETLMGLTQLKHGQDSGITCYYDENSWLKFGVFVQDTSATLKVVEHIGKETIVAEPMIDIDLKETKIYLRIKTEGLRRSFYYSLDGETYYKLLVREKVYYLSDEGISIGKRFTGAMIGLYVFGGEFSTVVPFDYFIYSSLETVESRS